MYSQKECEKYLLNVLKSATFN